MKHALAFGFAILAAACSPAAGPSRDAPGVEVEVADAPPPATAGLAAPVKLSPATNISATAPAIEYTRGSLCESTEQVIWTCQAGRRTISICASRDLSASEGYAQYRIGRPGALEMEYPATHVHPRGRFNYTLYAQGNQSVDFRRGGYDYRVFEDLRSPEDGVFVEQGGEMISSITCNGGDGFGPLSDALEP